MTLRPVHTLISRLFSYRPIRFIAAGGTAAVIHIGLVYVLTNKLTVWYVYATTIGFVSALAASFVLQKFFAYRDHRVQVIALQSSYFVTIAIINLVLNNVLMFVFVEYADFVPLTAQFITSGMIAVWSYIAYSFIFTKTPPQSTYSREMLLEEEVKE